MGIRRLACMALALGAAANAACASFQERPTDFGVSEASYVNTADRGRTFVLDRGEGPAVLLVHGYGSAHGVYSALVEDLVAAGYRVLAVDLPGFGFSDRNTGDYSPAGLAAHLVEILDAKGVERADVIAHSWGCSIALQLALDQPDRVGRLVLASAWVYESQIPPFFRWARARGVGEALFTLFYRERAADRYELSWYDPERFVTQEGVDAVERALGRPGTVAAALAAARGQRYTQVEERYGDIERDALLIWGRFDTVSTLDVAVRLEQDLPRARLVVLERCGHVPMIERAGRFQAEVMRFLGAARFEGAPQPTSTPEPAAPEPPAPEPAAPAEQDDWGAPPPVEAGAGEGGAQ